MKITTKNNYFLGVLQRLENNLIKHLDEHYKEHQWYVESARRQIINQIHKIDDEEYNRLVFGKGLKRKLNYNPFEKKGMEVK